MSAHDNSKPKLHSGISIRLSPAEHKRVRQIAKRCGMSISEYARQAIFDLTGGSNDHLPHELVQAVRVEMGCFNDSLRTWMSADSQHPHLPPIRDAFDKLIVSIDAILPEPNGG